MNTILVPTDFSDTARHATHYAISFAQQMNCKEIILYNSYQPPLVMDVNLITADVLDINDLQVNSEQQLEDFKNEIQSFCPGNISLKTLSDYGLVVSGINEICKENNADVIVMGVTGGSKFEEAIIGSYAVEISERSIVPVIIVPPDAVYTEIKEVMIVCDFKNLLDDGAITEVKKYLDGFKAKLFVVNIGHTHGDTAKKSLPDSFLESYSYEYESVEENDFLEALNNSAAEKNVDMIINISKKTGWFEGLFKKNHTKMLAFHSHVPLMVIHG